MGNGTGEECKWWNGTNFHEFDVIDVEEAACNQSVSEVFDVDDKWNRDNG